MCIGIIDTPATSCCFALPSVASFFLLPCVRSSLRACVNDSSYLGAASTNGSSTPPTAAGSWVVVANRTTGAEPPPNVAPVAAVAAVAAFQEKPVNA